MWIRIDVYNRQGEFLGSLPDEAVVVDEYVSYPIRLTVTTDQSVAAVQLQVGNHWLKKEGATFFFGSNASERGRRGQISLRVFYQNAQFALYPITVSGHRFTDEYYRYLIRDLKRLMVTLLASDETTVVGSEYDLEVYFLQVFDQKLIELEQFIEQLQDQLTIIEQAPHRTVEKQYHFQIESSRLSRVDARTIRWQATQGAARPGRILTFTNFESFDLYENQFIVYLCNQIKHFLAELPDNFQHGIDQKMSDIKQRIADWESYKEIGDKEGLAERRAFKEKQLSHLRQIQQKLIKLKQQKVPLYQARVYRLIKKIDSLKHSSLLGAVTLKPTFSLKPTLVLLRDPAYNPLYKAYIQVQQSLQLNELAQIDRLLGQTPRERTSRLYEYWVVLQVYAELRKMGFEDDPNSSGVMGLLEKDTFRLRSGGVLPLVGQADLYTYNKKRLTACLHYEHRFGPNGNFFPDIYITFSLGSTRILILDAKYRDYKTMPDFYERDVNGTAWHKYKLLQRWSHSDEHWFDVEAVDDTRRQIYASFIVHSHNDDNNEYLDYGSTGQANKYGAIPLVPQETAGTIHLRRLLRMFLRMHLHIFDVCWSESHARPVKAEHTPRTNRNAKNWEGKYHCPECGNSWWVNHCGHWCQGGNKNVPKITFSDPTDNFFDVDDQERKMGDKVLLKCSNCNQSYLRGV